MPLTCLVYRACALLILFLCIAAHLELPLNDGFNFLHCCCISRTAMLSVHSDIKHLHGRISYVAWHFLFVFQAVSNFCNSYPLLCTDNSTVCLFSIWFGNRSNCGSICPCSCLGLLSCCFSDKQGNICWENPFLYFINEIEQSSWFIWKILSFLTRIVFIFGVFAAIGLFVGSWTCSTLSQS